MEVKTSYFRQIDSLRAFAVLSVIVFHWFAKDSWINKLPNGSIGVTLFFVISGFLVSRILMIARNRIENNERSFKEEYRDFLVRRALRIFPLYYGVLFGVYALDKFAHVRIETDFFEHPFYYLFYLYNHYLDSTGNWQDLLSPFWSLSVEEQFYIVWPLLLLLIPAKHQPYLALMAVAIGLVSRVVLALSATGSDGLATVHCLDAFGIGAVFAYLFTNSKDTVESVKRRSKLLLAIGLILFIPCQLMDPQSWFVLVFKRFSIAAVSMYFVCGASLGFKGVFGRILNSSVLIYIGKISYGLYIFHMLIPSVFVPKLLSYAPGRISQLVTSSQTIYVSFCFVFLMGLASLSWYLFEKRFTDLKKYFDYKNASTDRISSKSRVPVK